MRRCLEWLFGVSSKDLAGTESGSLRLTGMPENLWILLGILAAFGFLGWLVAHCYRREGRTPVRIKTVLTALRLLVLVLLFFIILQPAFVTRFVREETSAVAVLVDDTVSMRWQDRYTEGRDRRALGALLQLSDAQLDGDARPSRTDLVRRALLRENGVVRQLALDHPLLFFRFGVTARDSTAYIEPLSETEEPEPAGRTGPDGRPLPSAALEAARKALDKLRAEGYHTNLARAMREVLNRLEGRRLAAVVLVSDGQNTGLAQDGSRVAGARQMAQQRGIPIYTVCVGDPRPPRNVVVAQLQGPREARQKSRLSFTVFFTQRSMPRSTAQIRLLRSPLGEESWEDTGVSAEVDLGGEEAAAEDLRSDRALREAVLVAEAPADVGTYVYKARIEPLREEMIAGDNEATATVRITDRKLSVLFVTGDAGWEFQYLRNYLLKMTEHYAVTVWQQNADPRFNQDASTGMKRTTLPATRDELFLYDVVVLYDPRPREGMSAELVKMLEEFVGKHHGGVCYIVGNKFTDQQLAPGGAFEPLGELLPVVLAREDSALALQMQAMKDQSAVQMAPGGTSHPLMQLASGSEANSVLWGRLPGTYRTQPVARLKTLATALAVNSDPGRATEDQQREPLIAVQYYGKGRVLYLGFDSTWRWRCLDEGVHYDRFWENAMDFLGAGRLEKKRILITTNGEQFDAGSDIRVRVEAYDRNFAPLPSRKITVTMRPIGADKGADHVLDAEKPGVYTGTLDADRIGLFELDAIADESGQADWTPEDVAVRRIEIRLPQEEFRRPESSPDALRDLAGGPERCVTLAEIDRLAERVPPAKLRVVTEVTHSVWDTRLMLIVLGLFLLAEWTVRKIFHMM